MGSFPETPRGNILQVTGVTGYRSFFSRVQRNAKGIGLNRTHVLVLAPWVVAFAN